MAHLLDECVDHRWGCEKMAKAFFKIARYLRDTFLFGPSNF